MIRRGDLLLALGAVVALAGLSRDWSVHAWKERGFLLRETGPRAGARFEPLRGLLPERGRIGFISDAGSAEERGRRLFEARFALAPLVVIDAAESPDAPPVRLTIADCQEPAHLEALARASGLRIRSRAGAVALLELPQ